MPALTSVGLIPHLVVTPAAEAIEFYKKAFGFSETMRMSRPDGGVLHCRMQLGDHAIMLADEWPNMGGCSSPKKLGGSSVTIHINTPDVDALFNQAVEAGATVTMPVADMFWGDRYGKLVDPFGHHWSIATHKEDVSPEEAKRRAAELFKNMKPK